MGNSVLQSFRTEGGWNSSYSSHYESAWIFLYDYEDTLEKLKIAEQRIQNENTNFPLEDLSSFKLNNKLNKTKLNKTVT
jgi:hypothetical protein